MAAFAATIVASACSQPMKSVKTNYLPTIPDAAYAKGVSAPFCGFVGDTLVLAGGANFPDKPLLEGGAKRVYADIWAFTGRKWIHAGCLPDSTAYGATFSVGGALIFAGGNVCGESSDKVYQVRLKNGEAVLKSLPQLPVAMEQCGWTQEGDTLYLAGAAGVFTCKAGVYSWEKVAELPEPLVQPVAYAHEGELFLWGGFNSETLELSDKGWCLSKGEWKDAPSIPDGGTFVGATGVTLQDGRLAVVGGVNRAIFSKALHNGPEDRIPYLSQDPSWYRFRKEVFIFDGSSWTVAATEDACALAGPGVAAGAAALYVAGGEQKPGVRSPKIFGLPL